jgi:hypothetical protein
MDTDPAVGRTAKRGQRRQTDLAGQCPSLAREPLSDSHSAGTGNGFASPKRVSKLSIIRPRMSPRAMPPVVAAQEIASRSQQSRVKAMRTRSPFSQPISTRIPLRGTRVNFH